ncbi:hypothetical protein RSW31_26625, partial [Escherichia coli]
GRRRPVSFNGSDSYALTSNGSAAHVIARYRIERWLEDIHHPRKSDKRFAGFLCGHLLRQRC